MAKTPLQKISAEQARMKRQWGYFKAEMRKQRDALSSRMDEIEVFFKRR